MLWSHQPVKLSTAVQFGTQSEGYLTSHSADTLPTKPSAQTSVEAVATIDVSGALSNLGVPFGGPPVIGL